MDHLGPFAALGGTSAGPLGPLGPADQYQAKAAGIWALTAGQELVCAIVALIFIAVFVVWPVVKPKRFNQQGLNDVLSQQRLKREIDQHGPSD